MEQEQEHPQEEENDGAWTAIAVILVLLIGSGIYYLKYMNAVMTQPTTSVSPTTTLLTGSCINPDAAVTAITSKGGKFYRCECSAGVCGWKETVMLPCGGGSYCAAPQ